MSIQREIVARMVKDLPKRFPSCGILVAGSVQRGEERPDSDLDLFVVLPGDGAVRLEQEESREGIKVDLAVFPEDGFQREVRQQWFKFWVFSQAEPVQDPTGIAKRNQELARSYFRSHPSIDRAWVTQMAEIRKHKADRSYRLERPAFDDFARHIERMVAESGEPTIQTTMKGLELSRGFFREWAFPVLNRAASELLQKVAVGLIGSNSQVLGYDDDLSRDHAWGPFFIIWTPDDMKPEDVQRIQDVLKAALPEQFGGIPLAAGRKIPFEMGDFAVAPVGQARRFLTGYAAGPLSDLDWLTIPENRLCEATAGEIFHDPAGLMESWRKSISYFPDNVWHKRISFTWVMLGATAQIRRCVERKDDITGHLWVSWFLEAGMRMGFLLARRYAPWRKWLFRRLKEVWPGDPRMPGLLQELAGATPLARQEMLMLDVLDILGNHANNSGQIAAQPLRREAVQHFTPFNFEGFALTYHQKVKGPLAQLPLDLGPVDMWGSLQAFTASPPVFMGNAEFIKATYGSG